MRFDLDLASRTPAVPFTDLLGDDELTFGGESGEHGASR